MSFFWHFRITFLILWEKRWASALICFWNYKLQKMRLLKCLKSPVLEHLWGVNMLIGPKHCLNLHGSCFIIFLMTLKKIELEKLCLRTLMDSQHGKLSETLPKSLWQYFCRIFWSVWKKISSNKSVLVGSQILRLCVNKLTPDEQYSRSVKASVERN